MKNTINVHEVRADFIPRIYYSISMPLKFVIHF